MSFITKRERVFNEYDLFDLPARNEGKLKAYASCTDARAWSHFCSDKTEHLVEIIKRNNETCRPKYVPTDVIVNTLMVAKNAEIARLKHRIEEFEQMLAAYDQLELTCDQKCEIANAHAAIKAANKELDDLCFDLDLSGFTEGIDSEAFELEEKKRWKKLSSNMFILITGKSRGDEPARYRIDETPRSKEMEWSFDKDTPPKMETKSAQMDLCPCDVPTCDASTLATDPRINELQETIIAKDAKLNAKQNTIAVMENDVCEPYCIYAHIYTALEKIFGILCQNDTYKQYLGLLTAGKDTSCIDITGKILFKLKVLEKFSRALIAPCSQDFNPSNQDCSCYRAEILTHIETTFALTSAESNKPCLDNKRAQLVADIMENEEMKEILSKESFTHKFDDNHTDDGLEIDNYSIDAVNLKRLKNLQENFDDLMSCYESIKLEKECFQIRCRKYEKIEKELETLRNQLIEYNTLWNEKEHYRKRSTDLDSLKEKYLILTEEASNLEVQLKAEAEINNIKSNRIEELRCENVMLEKRLNEAAIAFEKDKNAMQCKLKESECKIMCQEQQIKSLSLQIDRLLEQDHNNKDFFIEREPEIIALYDEIESLKEQLKNFKEALFCNDEEKQQLQNEFENNLQLINELKTEIEEWKSTNEKIVLRNEHLEKCIESFQDEINKLVEENRTLSQDVEVKSTAIENLMNVINGKSQEVQRLMENLENKSAEKNDLCNKLHKLRENYNSSVTSLENEKNQAIKSLELARQESQQLLGKVQIYDDMVHKQKNLTKALEVKTEDYNEIKNILVNTKEENKNLHADLANSENNNAILMQEIQRLREINNYALTNINSLQEEKNQYHQSLELNRKESEILEDKLQHFESMSKKLLNIQKEYDNLLEDKKRLENELEIKNIELKSAINSILLSRKSSEELLSKLNESDNIKHQFNEISEAYLKISNEKQVLHEELSKKITDLENQIATMNELKTENYILLQKLENHSEIETELTQMKTIFGDLLLEKNILQKNCLSMTDQITNLNSLLDLKINENKELIIQLKTLEEDKFHASNKIKKIKNENTALQNTLDTVKKENLELIDSLKHFDSVNNEVVKLKTAYDQVKEDEDKLRVELDSRLADLQRLETENRELRSQSQKLLAHSEDLEQALITARTELMTKPDPIKESYSDLIKQIADIRQEKENNQTKIRHLMDKLDTSENIISNLSEDLLARNDKIAILENHINELEEEIRKLHIILEDVVDTGEEMKNNSYEKIDQSLRKMEAHHSRAAHNMKMELAKLQNENKLLEEELSITKIVTEKSSKDKNDFCSQISRLENEREIIITDIKQLELKAVGDSVLSPNNCSVEEVLNSIDRIQKTLETHSNKSVTLEQTLLKVQTSSQLLLSKADEAKKIVEQKKTKIISEKEEAIKEKLNMERQLIELKEKLEKQTSKDRDIIKDLEGEILNQKLIMDKLNDSRQSYISKLEEEMSSLKDLYQNSMNKVTELQRQIQNLNNEKNNLLNIVKKVNYDLEEKCKDITILQNELMQLKVKPINDIEIQVTLSDAKRSMSSQTDKKTYQNYENIINDFNGTNNEKIHIENNVLLDNKHREVFNKPQSVNEVQVLTANIEPSFDYVQNNYKNYKLKQLRLCHLEYYSITCLSQNTEYHQTQSQDTVTQKADNAEISSPTINLVDIYNKNSMHTNSSKFIETETKSDKAVHNGYVLRSDSLDSVSKEGFNNMITTLSGSASHISTDKDFFVIYRDSGSNNAKACEKESWSLNDHSEVLMKELTNNLQKQNAISKKQLNQNFEVSAESSMSMNQSYTGELNFKPKLNINLPRVETQSPEGLNTTSDVNTKLLMASALSVYLPPKRPSTSDTKLRVNTGPTWNQHNPSVPSLPTDSKADNSVNLAYNMTLMHSDNGKTSDLYKVTNQKDKQKRKLNNIDEKIRKSGDHVRNRKDHSPSHHQLSRVGAGLLDIQFEKDSYSYKIQDDKDIVPGSFGLDFILETIERETDPNSAKTYDISKYLRKARSDEIFDNVSVREKTHSSPSRMSLCKISSTENNTNVTGNKSSNKTRRKSYMEKGVMVKMDISEDYQKKIKDLSKALANIEKDYKKKIEAIKNQYDNNIKSIINEHNQGVNSIQSLHEETLQDILKLHENEVENLRTMSIEAMRKAEKLEKENKTLKTKIQDCSSSFLETEPVRMSSPELRRRRKSRDTKTLTKTDVEAFNVKPKSRSLGPCTCSLDVNISDTIRNIFEQVDVEQRKMAEHTYLKYIANKMLTSNVETLDAQELSFLHFKVCRTWKMKLTKEEALQQKINSMENELIHKQRHAQKHIAELDRKVAEERRRLQEVREAVFRGSSPPRTVSPEPIPRLPPPPPPTVDKEFFCRCDNGAACSLDISERRSAGDLAQSSVTGLRTKRGTRAETNRAVLANLGIEERREKKLHLDELPTRLRKPHDRAGRSHKK